MGIIVNEARCVSVDNAHMFNKIEKEVEIDRKDYNDEKEYEDAKQKEEVKRSENIIKK